MNLDSIKSKYIRESAIDEAIIIEIKTPWSKNFLLFFGNTYRLHSTESHLDFFTEVSNIFTDFLTAEHSVFTTVIYGCDEQWW